MIGTNQSKVRVILRDPKNLNTKLTYIINPCDTPIAKDWIVALKGILEQKLYLEKNYCFLGFPNSARDLNYLCDKMNEAVEIINNFNQSGPWIEAGIPYLIEEHFTPDAVRYSENYPVATIDDHEPIGLTLKHGIMNRIHNHFERLQGTLGNLSKWYKLADDKTKYAIRQTNILCHEIESLAMGQRMSKHAPEWVRPSQITTYIGDIQRFPLKDNHKQSFIDNGYDREFAHVYMHWTQIGKTLVEVFRDERGPEMDRTICEAINSLKNYSGEFDVEWGKDVTYSDKCPWHVEEQDAYKIWLQDNDIDPNDPELCLGFMQIGEIDLEESFGTTDQVEIRKILGNFQDLYSIEVDGVKAVYDYCWTDEDYKEQQIAIMKDGYAQTSE
jgi:hypothetical protein